MCRVRTGPEWVIESPRRPQTWDRVATDQFERRSLPSEERAIPQLDPRRYTPAYAPVQDPDFSLGRIED